MAEQVDGGEHGGAAAQVIGRMQDEVGDAVVRVLAQLVCRQPAGDPVDRARVHDQQQRPGDDLQPTVRRLEQQSDPECPVQSRRQTCGWRRISGSAAHTSEGTAVRTSPRARDLQSSSRRRLPT